MEIKNTVLPTRETPPPANRSYRKGVISGLVAAFLILFLIAWIPALRHLVAGPGTYDQGAVVNQIRDLKRLETVQFTVDKVVSGERASLLPTVLTGDKILLVVRGEVVAGEDFSKLPASAISLQGRVLKIKLPPAEIFSARIDNSRTRVFSRQTGLLVTADPNLESEVRQTAEKDIQEAAISDGILNIAAQNARTTLSALAQPLGFDRIEFQ